MIKLSLILAVIVSALTCQSQVALQQSDTQMSAGVLGTKDKLGYFAGFDFGMTDQISAGIQYSNAFHYNHEIKPTVLNFVRVICYGNYHFNTFSKTNSKLDLYSGINFGIIHEVVSIYAQSKPLITQAGLQAGARFFLSEKFAVNLEVNANTYASSANLGLTYVFNY